ncbi:hypothetical protein EC973_008860 [Apophysomyces ossiformis]|uniref:Uncharacterized protein n=1 Tax=Apophysomyces ossiformis TaxID=679940 RepID=A0A8H7BYJ6_9FUNG|nr:hypothetical protein EC973_008860 [Apophysomyces ossiformis]
MASRTGIRLLKLGALHTKNKLCYQSTLQIPTCYRRYTTACSNWSRWYSSRTPDATIHVKDTAHYNQLLTDLAEKGDATKAQEVYDKVFRYRECEADMNTYTQLMLAYLRSGQLDSAMGIYYELLNHHEKAVAEARKSHLKLDSLFYHTLIAALTKNVVNTKVSGEQVIYAYTVDDDANEWLSTDEDDHPALRAALAMFKDMRQLDIQPSKEIYRDLLRACGEHKDSYVLEHIHRLLRMDIFFDPDAIMDAELMKAYHRIGNNEQVLQIWDTTQSGDSVDQDIVTVLLESTRHNIHQARSIWKLLSEEGYAFNTKHHHMYIEILCRDSKEGWEEAWKLVNAKSLADEGTVNILTRFAEQNHISEEDAAAYEAWKQKVL